jgi:hypothetical protein
MKKNRELENLISSSPDVLKEMLAELFERWKLLCKSNS